MKSLLPLLLIAATAFAAEKAPDELALLDTRELHNRGTQRLAEGHGLRGHHLHDGAALESGEDRFIDLLPNLGSAAQDHASAGAAQRLVRGRRDDLRE